MIYLWKPANCLKICFCKQLLKYLGAGIHLIAPMKPAPSFQSKRVAYWFAAKKPSPSSCHIRIADIVNTNEMQSFYVQVVSKRRSAKC